MKIVYIAHPIGGDVVGNLALIQDIIRNINLTEPDIVPCAPYFADCLWSDDNNPDERKRGLNNALELIRTGIFDEIRLYGNMISSGMTDEINAAIIEGTTVRPMTTGTYDMFEMAYPDYKFSSVELLNEWRDE